MKEEKKMSLQEWSMHYRQIIILLVSCLVALGIYGLANINKNEFPDFTIRQGIVVAVYPGVTSQEMEEQVTKPLEKYIFTYKEVKKEKTISYSKDGLSIIQVELNDELTNKDEFWSKFKHGVQGFKNELPDGVLAIQVNDDFGDTSALLLAMESNEKTYRELNDYMNSLIDSLRMIPSVGKMTVFGMQHDQISIYLNSDKLSHYGISYLTIAQQLRGKGFVTTAGRVKNDGYKSPIYVDHALNKIYDVENTVIYTDDAGNTVRLKDVATVKREYPQPKSYITNNGTRCILLSVEIKKGQDVSSMGKAINKKLANFKQHIPDDVQLNAITDQAKVVDDSIENFLHELLIAICTVILVVILIMPMRVALVAAGTMPITIFVSLGLFYMFDIELNTVTLAALIVTLGMIVDDSIVIIDSYLEMMAEGKTRWQASIGDLLPLPHRHDGTVPRLPALVPLGHLYRALRLDDYRPDAAAHSAILLHPQTDGDEDARRRQEAFQPARHSRQILPETAGPVFQTSLGDYCRWCGQRSHRRLDFQYAAAAHDAICRP